MVRWNISGDMIDCNVGTCTETSCEAEEQIFYMS